MYIELVDSYTNSSGKFHFFLIIGDIDARGYNIYTMYNSKLFFQFSILYFL